MQGESKVTRNIRTRVSPKFEFSIQDELPNF